MLLFESAVGGTGCPPVLGWFWQNEFSARRCWGGPRLHGGVASPSTWHKRHATMKTRRKEYRLHDNYYVEKLHARWWLSTSYNSLHWSHSNCCVPALYCRGQVTVSHAPAGKLKECFFSFFITKRLIILAWQSNKCDDTSHGKSAALNCKQHWNWDCLASLKKHNAI